jgi:hypothetical protein
MGSICWYSLPYKHFMNATAGWMLLYGTDALFS